jgi:hypothetical protein
MADSRHKASDAEVLRLRELHEVERKTVKQIVLDHQQYSEGFIRNVLAYTTRKKAGRPMK